MGGKNRLDKLGSPSRFGYEWSHFDKLTPEYEEQFIRWVSALGFPNYAGKYVVDAGCGTGRNSHWMMKFGARRIFAFDLEESTVQVARKNLSGMSGVQVEKCSIYDPSLPDAEKADLIFSIGVIHHLADPVLALQKLSECVKSGGQVLAWVYGKEGNVWILWFLQPIRKITKLIPMPILNALSSLLAIPLYSYLKLPLYKTEYLSLISKFKYWHLKSIVLDQLLPNIANYWTQDEVREIFEKANLRNIRIASVNGMSWSVVGEVV